MTAPARIRPRLAAALLTVTLPIALGPSGGPGAAGGRRTDEDARQRALTPVGLAAYPAVVPTGTGRIEVTPNPVSVGAVLGQQGVTRLTLRNTGTVPLTVEVRNRRTGPAGSPTPATPGPVGVPPAPPAGGWTVFDTPSPEPPFSDLDPDQFDTVAVSWRGLVYVFSASDADRGRHATRVARRYDPALGSWSDLPAMPEHRQKPAAATSPTPTAAAGTAVVDGRIYLVGGCTDRYCSETSTVLAFDPDTGRFAPRASYPHPVDAAGRWSRWLPPGRYEGVISGAGWTTRTQTGHIRPGMPAFDVVLDPLLPCPARPG